MEFDFSDAEATGDVCWAEPYSSTQAQVDVHLGELVADLEFDLEITDDGGDSKTESHDASVTVNNVPVKDASAVVQYEDIDCANHHIKSGLDESLFRFLLSHSTHCLL